MKRQIKWSILRFPRDYIRRHSWLVVYVCCVLVINGILRTEISAYLQDRCSEFEILQFNFFEKWLNRKVRNQRNTSSCAFAAGVACIEMHCRKSKIEVANSKKFYLDVQDAFENLYKVYPDGQVRECRYGDDDDGTSVEDVFTYAMDPGLVVTTECRSPHPKNFYSYSCNHPPRQKILSFTTLDDKDAFEYACDTPLVAGMNKVYNSFLDYEEVIYEGPLESELPEGEGHAVVIVGNARIKIDQKITNFFVILNSHGKSFGCQGYALIPTTLVDDFWLPVLNLQQLSIQRLKKICKGLTRQSHASATTPSKNQSGKIVSSGNYHRLQVTEAEEGSQNSGSRIPNPEWVEGEVRD